MCSNVIQKLKSFLGIGLSQKEFLLSHKLLDHTHEELKSSELKEGSFLR